MTWHPVSEPPDTKPIYSYGPTDRASAHLLGWDGREMYCVRYVTDSGYPPQWRTTCSEGWDVTKLISHYCALPEPPKT